MVEGVSQAHLPQAPWRELLRDTIGVQIVVLGRQGLFVENTLTPISPLLHNRNAGTLVRVLRLWAVMLAANIAATFVFT